MTELLPVLSSLLFLGWALLLRQVLGSWLAPGALFALAWAVMIIAARSLAADFYATAMAQTMLVALIGVGTLGAVIGQAIGRRNPAQPASKWQPPRLSGLLVVATGLGFLAVVLTLRSRGLSVLTFTSSEQLFAAARAFSVARYQHDYVPPVAVRLLLVAIYFGCLLGGLRAGLGRGRRYWLAILPLLPPLALTLLLTTRATVIWALILWLGAYFAVRLWRQRGGDFSLYTLLWFGLAALGMIGLFLGVQLMRGGNIGDTDLLPVLMHLRVWFFGYLAAFSAWTEMASIGLWPEHWGARSLAGVYQLIGGSARPQGLYQNFVTIAPYTQSNVFTVFRPLLEDFGLLGGCVVLAFSGAAAGFAYSRVIAGYHGGIPIVAAFFAMVVWSHVTSLFAYNSLLLAFLMFALYVWLAHRIRW